MAVNTLTTLFSLTLQNQRFSNAYLVYGFQHPNLVRDILALIATYFKQSNANFSDSKDSIENCVDIVCYAGTESIKIDDVRAIKERVKYGATQYPRLFVIIENADKMTLEAANAFLKVCEEPLPDVSFFLTTNHINKIIPTILSRCQQVFCASDGGNLPKSGLLFEEFLKKDLLSKLEFCSELAADKELAIEQLHAWAADLGDLERFSGEQVSLILGTLERLQFNVNLKAQLESLALGIHNR